MLRCPVEDTSKKEGTQEVAREEHFQEAF